MLDDLLILFRQARMVCEPISLALNELKAPLKLPIGLRTALTIYTSFNFYIFEIIN